MIEMPFRRDVRVQCAPTLHVVRQSARRLTCALGETGRRQDTVRVGTSWDRVGVRDEGSRNVQPSSWTAKY